MEINASQRVGDQYPTPADRRRRRMTVQLRIEQLSRSARGGGPLTPSQNAELDALVRELNELDAADLLDQK